MSEGVPRYLIQRWSQLAEQGRQVCVWFEVGLHPTRHVQVWPRHVKTWCAAAAVGASTIVYNQVEPPSPPNKTCSSGSHA